MYEVGSISIGIEPLNLTDLTFIYDLEAIQK